MRKKIGLPLGLLTLLVILLLPTPPDLSTAGHRMLAILVFSVVIWMCETVSYPVSAAIIISLMAFLLGTAPNMMNPDKVLGTFCWWEPCAWVAMATLIQALASGFPPLLRQHLNDSQQERAAAGRNISPSPLIQKR